MEPDSDRSEHTCMHADRQTELPGFDVCFMACADHLVTEFDQIKSISAFKDVHSNTGIFGIHASTVSIIFTCTG